MIRSLGVAEWNRKLFSIDETFRATWSDYAIMLIASGVFVALAAIAKRPQLPMHMFWANGLLVLLLLTFLGAGWWLWKRTRFC